MRADTMAIMKISGVDFQTIDWPALIASEHAGVLRPLAKPVRIANYVGLRAAA
jgi:hypothetical protein